LSIASNHAEGKGLFLYPLRSHRAEVKEMNLLKITFLLTCLTLLLIAMGSAIGGQSGMLVAFAIACGMNFFSYWYSDKIILKMYKAREVSETENAAFYGMVRRLAQQANMPMPKVYIIPSEGPNAFATGRGAVEPLCIGAEGFAGRMTQQRPHALAATEGGVAHRCVQAGRSRGSSGQ
jgi:heat shock protein HtpX